jgi:hypothetical protein
MFPIHLAADTLVLKSGRKIDAVKCRELGDQIKCQLRGGAIIGFLKTDVVEVWKDFKAGEIKPSPQANKLGKENLPPNTTGFRFDIWRSGISVRQAINVAEAKDLPLHRGGLISANKNFNPKMCRPYADTASKFYYKDQIFGKWATLNLDFTPVSKKLYSVEIRFGNTGNSKDSAFRQQIEAMLREKYGKPLGVNSHMGVYTTYDWKINDKAIVTMRPGPNYVHVSYLDKAIAKTIETELAGQVREGFTKNDKSKF